MATKKSFDTGMLMFYEFEPGEKFVGRFTGKMKQVGKDSHPVFVDEDGQEWLLNNHSMIQKVCKDLPHFTLVEIIYKGQVTIKSTSRKFSNYTVNYFTDESDPGQTEKEKAEAEAEANNQYKETVDSRKPEREAEESEATEKESEAVHERAFGKGRNGKEAKAKK